MTKAVPDCLRPIPELVREGKLISRIVNHDPGDEDASTEREPDYGLTLSEEEIRDALLRGREEADTARGIRRPRNRW